MAFVERAIALHPEEMDMSPIPGTSLTNKFAAPYNDGHLGTVELAERLLPEFLVCSFEGTRYSCYTQEQQVQLNLLEENARTWRNQLLITTQLHFDQAALVVNLTVQLVETGEIVTAERAHNVALTAQLMTEIEEKNRYRAEADSTDWWPLLVGGVVGLLGAGVAIGVALVAALGGFNDATTSP